jgi:N-acetylglutamate synthase
VTADLDLVRALQDRAARAVPAAVQEHRAGCWLRHTDSATTWWAGAALLHGRVRDVGASIATVERWYAAHGAAVRVQVCPACPPGLDDALAARGYRRSGDVSLQVADATAVADQPAAPLRVDMGELPDPAWCRLLADAQQPGADAAAELRLLQRVTLPSAYATARLDGRPVAVGRVVAEAGWAGLFGMATRPEARRRGAARAVLVALAGQARARGCARLYLQVTADSPAALALYRGAGFAELCRYHYRER